MIQKRGVLLDVVTSGRGDFWAKSVEIRVFASPTGSMQGSEDFWAQAAKIRPFTTSTGFFRI